MEWFARISDIRGNHDRIRRNRYGVIVTDNGQLDFLQFRPWPKLISGFEVNWFDRRRRHDREQSRCCLFYNQPLAHPNYLSLAFIQSSWNSSFRNFHLALKILDSIAWIKRSDAILCEVTNSRISDRLLLRWGWERHLPNSRKRHWIKRFYGDYSGVALRDEA